MIGTGGARRVQPADASPRSPQPRVQRQRTRSGARRRLRRSYRQPVHRQRAARSDCDRHDKPRPRRMHDRPR